MKKNMNRKTSLWCLIGFVLIIVFLQPVLIVSGEEGDYIESWDSCASDDPYDITTDGTNIWILDKYPSYKVCKYNMAGVYIDSWKVDVETTYPGGITTDGSNIWISDIADLEIYKYNMAGGYIGSWDTSGQGTDPRGIATDGSNIWIIDRDDDEVYKYNMAGGYIDSWDTGAADDGYSITTDGSNIWILDYQDHKAYKFNMTGGYVTDWLIPGEVGDFMFGIATDGVNIFTTYQHGRRVYKLSMAGSQIANWDTGAANDPQGITTDGTNIWIVDNREGYNWPPGTGDDRIHKFTMAGDYVDCWDVTGYSTYTSGIATDGSNIWIVNRIDDEVYKYNMAGGYIGSWDTSGQGDYPYGITTDGSNIWIVDADDDEVYKYNMAGGYIGSWDTSGEVGFVSGITTDGTNIWLVDTADDEVYKYDMEGGYIDSWDISGQMGTPRGITTYGDYEVGYFWIPDYDDHLVHKYDGPDVPPPAWDANVTLIDIVNATGDGTNYTDDQTVDVFEWGSSWGDSAFWYVVNSENVSSSWVFEGKRRYHFMIDYENESLSTVEQFGLRFTDDMDQTHTIWYDRDANTLTVTSPYDGISGWVHYFNQVGTEVRVIFQIMFNKPIPDSYDVQLQFRVVSDLDSGWLTPEGGIFNIYNLGGLSTLYDTGMAGRVLGGDIFEIYAADTRTPILVPPEGFDVRDNPINWWEWGQSEEDLLEDVDWMIWMPRREDGLTMYPTNQLPGGAPQSARAYHSYPFGLRIIDNKTDENRYMYMEKNFWREIEASDDELVFTQFHMMNPDVGEYGDPGAGGEIRVMDRSIKQEGFAYLALQLRFSSTGYLTAYNDTASGWVNVTAVNNYQWYNVTAVFNLTTQLVDVYVEDVLKLDDLPFNDEECTSLKTLWVGRANAAVIRNDFYVDDIHAWTDWDKDYGGISEATMLFDMNQHWSMDFDFFIEDGQVHAQGASGASVGQYVFLDDYSDHGYWEFGWDVMINKTLVHDFLVASVNVSDGRIGSRDNWVKYNVSWYSQGDYIKSDLLYGIFEGYSIFPGSDKDTSGWHWDIWFNRANASTIVGARLNTEYYGMSDKSVWWAVWSSLWKPMRTEVSESTLFVDLEDAGGTIHSAQDVSFVRSWVQVLRTNEAEFAYKIVNTGSLEFMIATDTMSGIDTPPIRDTMVPDVPSGFFGSALGGIFSAALKRLGNTLAGFGMGFFSMSIDFIDNIFAALGYPALVSTIFGWMDSLFASVPTLVGYGMTLIGNIFNLINTSASNTLTQLTAVITIWLGMYSTTMDFLNGVLTPGFNLWNNLGISSFIQVGAIMYPLWLLILASEKGVQAVIDHLNGVLNIGSFFLNFILNVAGFFMGLLTGLIGAIRG